ncbi:hypothetical protein Sjap_022863 [Stephania japonica]|uniref:Homeobox domain-containing protein n=1 Tax=Stephania japonica TaxID=461633 RepID=A0AAP0HUS7_9MAGN
MGSMKVHQFTRGFWEHEPSLTLGCKRLRPLAPRLTLTTATTSGHDHSSITALDLKSFIKADSGPRKIGSNEPIKRDSPTQVEAHSGGTRWNPTQDQIRILEMLYRGGMRTPNAQQIEQITAQLSKYGKIEGKNVFYWFQNHKARERQKQKRNSLGLSHSPRTPPPPPPSSALADATSVSIIVTDDKHAIFRMQNINLGEVELKDHQEDSPYKRKQRSWAIECFEEEGPRLLSREEGDDKTTLELFPLHPESR